MFSATEKAIITEAMIDEEVIGETESSMNAQDLDMVNAIRNQMEEDFLDQSDETPDYISPTIQVPGQSSLYMNLLWNQCRIVVPVRR